MALPPLSKDSHIYWPIEGIYNRTEKKEVKNMDITNEIITNDLKRKVEKIRTDRKNTIKEIVDLLYSDVIFLNNYRLSKQFRDWLIENKFFPYKEEIKKKRKIKMIDSPEYNILSILKFKRGKEVGTDKYDFYGILFDGDYHEMCPYSKNSFFYLLGLNGEIWLKYELILNKLKESIPLYLKHFYEKELFRLCDKNLVKICEACGTKNEKCSIYCNICGMELND